MKIVEPPYNRKRHVNIVLCQTPKRASSSVMLRFGLLSAALLRGCRRLLAVHFRAAHLAVHALDLRDGNTGAWPVVVNRVVPVR
jgi:hypothetical protein